MDTKEFQQYTVEQFSNINKFQQFVIDKFDTVATKDDLSALKDDLYLNMATKSDIVEVKDMIARLDRRTDEDIKSTIKDVEKIKGVLKQQGHQI